MSEAMPRAGMSPLAANLLGIARRLVLSVLPFAVVILLWQFASLFFPRFLFPSLIDVFWRCIEIFSTGSMFADVLATVFRILAGLAGAFIVGGLLALLMVRSRAIDRFLSPILSLFQGIPAAVLGGIRHHLVSWRRVSHLLHHGDDDIAGVYLSGARRAARDVAGSDGDGVQFPPHPHQAVPGDDRAGHPAGHFDRVEGQSRQRLARGGGRRTGRCHRRRRL
jgi:hypothetical protein